MPTIISTQDLVAAARNQRRKHYTILYLRSHRIIVAQLVWEFIVLRAVIIALTMFVGIAVYMMAMCAILCLCAFIIIDEISKCQDNCYIKPKMMDTCSEPESFDIYKALTNFLFVTGAMGAAITFAHLLIYAKLQICNFGHILRHYLLEYDGKLGENDANYSELYNRLSDELKMDNVSAVISRTAGSLSGGLLIPLTNLRGGPTETLYTIATEFGALRTKALLETIDQDLKTFAEHREVLIPILQGYYNKSTEINRLSHELLTRVVSYVVGNGITRNRNAQLLDSPNVPQSILAFIERLNPNPQERTSLERRFPNWGLRMPVQGNQRAVLTAYLNSKNHSILARTNDALHKESKLSKWFESRGPVPR